MLKTIKNSFLLLLVISYPLSVALCDTHTAVSLSTADVQAAINAAIDGDTVILPPGISTWTASVHLINKGITIKGAGSDQTRILNSCPSLNGHDTKPIYIESVKDKPFRITGIGFFGLDGVTVASPVIWITGINDNGPNACTNWRIDHCRFDNQVESLYLKDHAWGLVDHCTFYFYAPSLGTETAIWVRPYPDGDADWLRPLTLGTSNAFCIEDNVFDFQYNLNNGNTNTLHSDGGRFIFRHNTVNNIQTELFDTCTSASDRGSLSTEINDNNLIGTHGYGFNIFGGTYVLFNNTFSAGYDGHCITAGSYRSCPNANGCWAPAYGKICNGFSVMDGNSPADATASGSHTGANSQSLLACNGKNWINNQWVNYVIWNTTDNSKGFITANTSTTITAVLYENYVIDIGTHTGTDNSPALTSTGKQWKNNDFVNYYIWNLTDNSNGKITANTANTITAVLSGGTDNDWDNGDVYKIQQSSYDAPAKRKNWNNGDAFKITNGYPCLDQFGRGPGPVGNQPAEPIYQWNNTQNGSNINIYIKNGCATSFPNTSYHIIAGRDYYDNTPRPGYVPFIYPHPLQYILGDAVDTSSPTAPGAVYDGTGADAAFTFSTTTLSANWTTGSDVESGIGGYMFAIGTTSGGTELKTWTTITNVLSTTTAVNLTIGTTYYFRIKSINGVGLISETATNSDGQCLTKDGTPPIPPGIVRDGTGPDISTTTSNVQLSANWDAGSDTESGISGYQYSIGTSAGATDTLGWQALGNVLTITKNSLNLTIGATYYFSVKSINGAGLISTTATNSNGVVVVSTADTTPPNPPGIVLDGATPGLDIPSTKTSATLSANWTAGSDTESGITGYQYAIGTTPGAVNTAGWTTLGNMLIVTRDSLTLSAGTTYYFSIKSINGNNLVSATATNSNGQYVVAIDTSDTTPPTAPAVVRDGTGADESATTLTTQLSANWDPSTDSESGIAKYWYAIGSISGGSDIVVWTDNGQATYLTAINLALSTGVTYYVSVKSENGVGMQSSTTTSSGQVVLPPDTSSPTISGVSAQSITQTGATIIWTTDEPATSQVNFGRTTAYGKYTMEDSTLNTSHSVALTELVANSVYHFRVISKNASGNTTTSLDYTFTTLSPVIPISPDIHAYPNPAKPSSANPMKFRIAGMINGEVNIYTISGRLIKKMSGTTEINWDGKNTDGEKVGRGIYIYKITSSNGDSVTGKIALTK